MKQYITSAALISAVACQTNPTHAQEKTSLCEQNTRNRVTIIIQGNGGKSTQGKLALCNGKNEEFSSRVTTGKPHSDGGVWTPEGHFTIGEMNANRRSRSYNNAPMPYAMHVHQGIFIHQGKTGGNNASHGCVRLPAGNAKTLFSQVGKYKQSGAKVNVIIKNTNPNN